MNGRFPIAMHIMTLLASANGEWVSSDFLAGSININPALVRKEIVALRQQGLVSSREGKNGGSALAKPAHQIQLADIYRATRTEAGPLLGRARNTPNPACPVGRQINTHLTTLFTEAEQAMLDRLSTQSLAEFVARFG